MTLINKFVRAASLYAPDDARYQASGWYRVVDEYVMSGGNWLRRKQAYIRSGGAWVRDINVSPGTGVAQDQDMTNTSYCAGSGASSRPVYSASFYLDYNEATQWIEYRFVIGGLSETIVHLDYPGTGSGTHMECRRNVLEGSAADQVPLQGQVDVYALWRAQGSDGTLSAWSQTATVTLLYMPCGRPA